MGPRNDELVADRLPGADLVLFFDEPALVLWRDGDGPLDREDAQATCLSTAHRGHARDRRRARVRSRRPAPRTRRRPAILHFDIGALDLDDAATLGRFLDGDGWVAWGAIPTDGPIAAESAPLWKRLARRVVRT